MPEILYCTTSTFGAAIFVPPSPHSPNYISPTASAVYLLFTILNSAGIWYGIAVHNVVKQEHFSSHTTSHRECVHLLKLEVGSPSSLFLM